MVILDHLTVGNAVTDVFVAFISFSCTLCKLGGVGFQAVIQKACTAAVNAERAVYGNTYRTQGEKDQYDRKLSCQRQKQCFSLFRAAGNSSKSIL